MANYSGNSTAIPELDRQVVVSPQQQPVQYATQSAANPNAGQAFQTLADVLSNVSAHFEKRLDLQAKFEGQRAGAAAGSSDTLPEKADDATIRGLAFNQSAHEAVSSKYELQGRLALNDYEQSNLNDPASFQAAADQYAQGVLPKLQQFDPAVAQQWQGDYDLRVADAKDRIQERQRAVMKDQQTETALNLQLAASDEMGTQAASLFTGDPSQAHATLARMMTNAAKVVDIAHQIGPDGTPLFSAVERVTMQRKAQEGVAEQVGAAWMQAQPDKLKALQDWQNGTATIGLDDGQGNKTDMSLKDMLGDEGYVAASTKIVENLKNNISLQNDIQAQQDRNFKQGSDQLYGDLSSAAQDGKLTLPIIEASKASLEPEKYVTLRALAKSGSASVSDGATYSRLASSDADGNDIRGDLRTALGAGQLTTQDFMKLYDQNTDRLEKGTTDPVATGRDYVSGSLGKLATTVGMPQSIAIGQANAEYAVDVSDFIKQKGRQPSTTEALDIAKDVTRRYSVLDTSSVVSTLPLPKFMTNAQKFSSDLKPKDISDVAQKTRDYFLQQHGGDPNAMKTDEGYISEMKLLKQYSDLITAREVNAPTIPAR